MSGPDVVVGIPTFRRPRQLTELLASLRPELTDRVALVLVADNDCDPGTPDVVAGALGGCVAHRVIDVPEPGISQVRNALIDTTYGVVPGWQWLVMLDDDGVVLPGWSQALLRGAERFDADVAGGPVLGDLPPGSSILARNSIFGSRPRFPTGPVGCLNGAQNIAVRRRLADRLDPPWFRPDLGRTGGEDYAFFRRVTAAGGRLVWCDDALVREPTPADRLGVAALLRRVFRSNVVNGGIDAGYAGQARLAPYLLAQGRYLTRELAAAVVRRDPDRLTRMGIATVSTAGRAIGMAKGARDRRSAGALGAL